MLILLPPSEGKAAARRGKPLDLDDLAFPALTGARERVRAGVVAVSPAPPRAAAKPRGRGATPLHLG